MTTRMVHPQHGATHAYDLGEVERLKGLGWDVEATLAHRGPPPVAVPIPNAVGEAPIVKLRKKPGRPAKAK